jgi:hypothetical protein
MQMEYNRTRKDLAKKLRRKHTPEAVKIIIDESILLLNDKLSAILTLYIGKAFKGGKEDAEAELGDAIKAAAPVSRLSDPALGKITHSGIGSIGKYNLTLTKKLRDQYDTLLSDNKLANSLKRDGWSPWMGETLKKRGIDPKVISLVKQQSTSAKMVSLINQQGIHGGLHPDQVGRRLEPYVNRYFGPGGVEIDNVGKTVKQLRVDADGNYKWVNHKVTRKYRATTRTYSRLLARNSMKRAHQDAYYQSLQETNLVDHYISVSVLDSRTCGDCAMMHGQPVTRGTGPQYHGNCHCDLKPIWKKDSLLGDKNKDPGYYMNQRDRHFLAADDLKRYNKHMPVGSKLKHYTMLPEGARTTVWPGHIKMQAIRNRMLGMPAKIGPKRPRADPKPKPAPKPKEFDENDWGMTDDEWRAEADYLWAKTVKDGNEHMKLYNGRLREFTGTKTSVTFTWPKHPYTSLHTHPNWDAPLSPPDMTNFLASKYEKFCGAASNNHIFIVRKRPGYQPMYYQDQANAFAKAFDAERRRLINLHYKKVRTGTEPDHTDITIRAGTKLAEKYGLDYRVMKRRP